MARFIVKRLLSSLIVIFVIITISFFLMRFAPGGPFDEDRQLPRVVEANKWITYGMGDEVSAPVKGKVTRVAPLDVGAEYDEGEYLLTITAVDGVEHDVFMPTSGKLVQLSAKVGADVDIARTEGGKQKNATRLAVVPKPLLEQYFSAVGSYLTLDFGTTFSSGGRVKVIDNLAKGFPVSLELGLYALVIAFLMGVSAGFIAALYRNTWIDHTIMGTAMIGISVPIIVTGPLLLLIFVEELGVFDFGGWGSWDQKVLPVMTLALVYIATFSRLARGGMLEIIGSDYVRTARAKGLSERKVVTRHALRGALVPSVSYLGPAMARIVTGSVVVEQVFKIPGLSKYFVTPALDRDYPMVIGVVVLYSALLIVMNLLVDIAYSVLDPRVKLER